MIVNVLAFARLRDALGFSQRRIDLPDHARVSQLWDSLCAGVPEAAVLRTATRVARNGHVVNDDAALTEGDEIALLPPVSGG